MVTCIVQARMGSTRLRGKVLKEILGEPVILLCLKRLQKAKYIDKLIMATSDLNEDQALYEAVKSQGFEVFRGDQHNVLKRYADCVKQYGGDIVVRITGDCPLIDPEIVDHVISYYKMHCFDYVRLDVPNTFVRGFDVEVFSREALLRTLDLAKEKGHQEHVTLYMYQHPEVFLVGYVKGDSLFQKDYRLCLDTKEDLMLITQVFEHFKTPFVSAKEVIHYLDENPELLNMNRNVVQKQV